MKLALLLLVACRSSHVTSCSDDLTGAWRGESGAWMVLDTGDALEIYPLFDDLRPGAAPRVIDLRRDTGKVHRRYERGVDICEGVANARLLKCDGSLELVLGDPLPPATFTPCAWAGSAPTRREVWDRVE